MNTKTLLLSLLLMLVRLTSYAQQPIAAAPIRTEEYCQLTAIQRINSKFKISIDYGQQRGLLSNNIFRDAQGQPIEFDSAMAALNWLNAQGWELVNALTAGQGSDEFYYIMRRRIQP